MACLQCVALCVFTEYCLGEKSQARQLRTLSSVREQASCVSSVSGNAFERSVPPPPL